MQSYRIQETLKKKTALMHCHQDKENRKMLFNKLKLMGILTIPRVGIYRTANLCLLYNNNNNKLWCYG